MSDSGFKMKFHFRTVSDLQAITEISQRILIYNPAQFIPSVTSDAGAAITGEPGFICCYHQESHASQCSTELPPVSFSVTTPLQDTVCSALSLLPQCLLPLRVSLFYKN